jgi:tetratricopeptide (TPR) repeat protein
MNCLRIILIASVVATTTCSFAKESQTLAQPDAGLPGLTKSEVIPDWVARWELARCLSILKRYDEAIADYQILLKEKPELHKARLECAQVLFWSEKRAEADTLLEKIDASQLTLAEQGSLADLYVILKKYELAAPLYRAVLAATPEDHKTRLKLAEMLSWEKKYVESLAEYTTLLKALPDDQQIRRKYALVLIWNGQHEAAIPELRKTLP